MAGGLRCVPRIPTLGYCWGALFDDAGVAVQHPGTNLAMSLCSPPPKEEELPATLPWTAPNHEPGVRDRQTELTSAGFTSHFVPVSSHLLA